MIDADAFLRTIREQPDEDVHRLVYADWLDEQGDADRAAFIRAQCRLARLAPGDPDGPALRARVIRLLARQRRGWLGASADALEKCGFRRGFVEEAWPSGRIAYRGEWARLDPLFAAEPLRALRCEGPPDVGWPHWGRLERLAVVKGFEHGGFPAVVAGRMREALALPATRGLRELEFGQHALSPDDLAPILSEPHCRGLDRFFLRLTADSHALAGFFLNRPDLWPRRVGIGLNLPIRGHDLDLPDDAAARIAELEVTRWPVDGMPLEDVHPRWALGGLRSLRVGSIHPASRGNPLDPWLRDLLTGPARHSLERLSLMAERLDGPGLAGLIADGPFERLTDLTLWDAGLGDADARRLAGQAHLGRLRRLILAGHQRIGPTGVAALCESPHLRNLEALDLGSVPPDGDALAALSAASFAPTLGELRLSCAKQLATFVGMVAKAELPALNSLVLRASTLPSETALRKLFRAAGMPNLAAVRFVDGNNYTRNGTAVTEPDGVAWCGGREPNPLASLPAD